MKDFALRVPVTEWNGFIFVALTQSPPFEKSLTCR
jgi:hypothetical protein